MNEYKYEIDNTYIHYVKFGTGSKNLAIVSGVSLCGFEGLGAAIAKQYQSLANDYTCYVFDRKAVLQKGCTVDSLSDDLYKLMKDIGIDKTDLLGYSQGGMISISMAIRHPEIVSKLVLVSTTAGANVVSNEVWAACRKYLNDGDVQGFNMYLYEKIYSESFFKTNKAALERLANRGSKEQIERFIYLTESMDKFDARDDIARIICPCYVIGAAHDHIFGVQESVNLASALNCGLYIYEDQAHAAYDEASDFNDIVLKFLRNT